jgi:uncharacterized membrane protein
MKAGTGLKRARRYLGVMMLFLASLFAVGAILLALDMLWLGRIAGKVYRRELGPLLLDKPRMIPAAVFYVALVAGLAFFAILPNLPGLSSTAGLYGGALGFMVYAGYDAVNRATLKDFSQRIMLIDWTWGTFLCAVSSGLAHWVVQRVLL